MGSIISSPLPGFGLSLVPMEDPYMTNTNGSPYEDLHCIGDELDRAYLEHYRSLHSHRGTRRDAAAPESRSTDPSAETKPVAIGLGIIGVNFDFCGNPVVDPMHDESRIVVAEVLDDVWDYDYQGSPDFDRVTVSDDENDNESGRAVSVSNSNSVKHVLEWNTPRSPRYNEFYDFSPAQEEEVCWVVPTISYRHK
jgi:hypothetical protein